MFHPIFLLHPAMTETRKESCYSNPWYLSIKLLIKAVLKFQPILPYPLLVLMFGLFTLFGLKAGYLFLF